MTDAEKIAHLEWETKKLKLRLNLLISFLVPFARKFGVISAQQAEALQE
jgi:hypothetical protein